MRLGHPFCRTSVIGSVALVLALTGTAVLSSPLVGLIASDIFIDDFNDGDSSSWVTFAGGWSESGGVYHARNTGANIPVESVFGGGFGWSDYEVSVEVIPLSKHSPVETGLLFRFNERTILPTTNLAQCTLLHARFNDGRFGSFLRLAVDNTGQHEELVAAPFNWQPNTRYTLRATVVGNDITCSVDGGPSVSATSNIIDPTGTVGLRSTHIQSDYDNLVVRFIHSVVAVDIDIKPGSDPNGINVNRKGSVPVAILTTSVADGDASDFDATLVDALTVRFGPAEAAKIHPAKPLGHIEDVDGDGDLDLLLHFLTSETLVACGDTEATLTGETLSGQAIEGTDSVKIVPCR